jgi:hypothetical protein
MYLSRANIAWISCGIVIIIFIVDMIIKMIFPVLIMSIQWLNLIRLHD